MSIEHTAPFRPDPCPRPGDRPLTEEQADRFECLENCGYNQLRDRDPDRSMRPVGFGPRGQTFVCSRCDNHNADACYDHEDLDGHEDHDLHGDTTKVQIDTSVDDDQPSPPGDYTHRVVRRIATAIAASDLTTPEVAVAAGMEPETLLAVLRGRRGLFVYEVLFLARALGMGLGIFDVWLEEGAE